VKRGDLNSARFDARLDDLVSRIDRAEERHDAVQHTAFEKLDSIERQVSLVETQLSKVSTQLTTEQANMHRHIEKLHEYHANHERVLRGRNGHVGLLVRTDRVEQYVAASRWTIRAVVAVTVTLCGTAMARWIAAQ